MSQNCALSTEQLWHRYQPSVLGEEAFLGRKKSMLCVCIAPVTKSKVFLSQKPLYAVNNSLLPVQTRGVRNKRLSSRHGNREA